MSVATAVIGGVFWIVAGFLWVARRDERRALAQLEGVDPSVGELTAGTFSAVRGEVRSAQPETDPVTGEPVAYWEARLERLDDAGRRVRLLLVEGGEELTVDGVRVALHGAQIDIDEAPPVRAEGIPNEAMRALLEGTPHALPPPDETRPEKGVRWELTVRRITLGETLTLLGTPIKGDDGLVFDGLPRLTPTALEVIVEEERLASRAMDRLIVLAAVIGVGAFLAAVLLAVA
ncbi:MAG: hypothetical protein AB8I08_14285 [Sandaracinaceae bacterium]